MTLLQLVLVFLASDELHPLVCSFIATLWRLGADRELDARNLIGVPNLGHYRLEQTIALRSDHRYVASGRNLETEFRIRTCAGGAGSS
jgi:hypothetical protein